MSDFWERFNSGQITDKELLQHLIFFEESAGAAEHVGLPDMWKDSEERKTIKDELLKRSLLTEKGMQALSALLREIGISQFERKIRGSKEVR